MRKGVKQTKITINTSKYEFILFLFFLIFKLDGVITWKWIWIFSPFWITWIAFEMCSIIPSIVSSIKNAIENIKRNQDNNTRYSGQKLYWDNTNKRMYGPFEEE